MKPGNPSARYLTLTKLLGRSERDPTVRASRAAIPQAPPARGILMAQYPQGYWMRPGVNRSPRYRATVWQVLILAQLGIERCATLDRAIAHVFQASQRADGAFQVGGNEGDTPLGLNASLLWALETLGYGDEPPVRRGWGWLQSEVDGLRRAARLSDDVNPSSLVKVLWAGNAVRAKGAGKGTSCAMRTVASLLLGPPSCSLEETRDPAVWGRSTDDGRGPAASYVVDRVYGGNRGEASCASADDGKGACLTADPVNDELTFPLTEDADLLQWIQVLTKAGYGGHPRVRAARERLRHKRLTDGGWPLERVPGKLWADFGELDERNKWITIRAFAAGL